MSNPKTLFADRRLDEVLMQAHYKFRHDLERVSDDDLASDGVETAVDHLMRSHRLAPPILDREAIEHDSEEKSVPRPITPDMDVRRGSKPMHRVREFMFLVPFSGDYQFFGYLPSKHVGNLPHAAVVPTNVVFLYQRTEEDQEAALDAATAEFDQDLERLVQMTSYVRADIRAYNEQIETEARQYLNEKSERVEKVRLAGAKSKYPLRRRGDAPAPVPAIQRKVARPPASAVAKPRAEQPDIEFPADEYEYILRVINDTGTGIERSANSFNKLLEEDLRWVFVVNLNSHYAGQATGESFNLAGKTDILVNVEGRNVFIAECKVWTGKGDVPDAIDQLLSYTTWRDTRTALIFFNKNKTQKPVLDTLRTTVEADERVRGFEDYDSESGFRFRISKNEADPEVVVTALVFHVPEATA